MFVQCLYIFLRVYNSPSGAGCLPFFHYVSLWVPFDYQCPPEALIVADASWLKAKPAALSEVAPSVPMARLPTAWRFNDRNKTQSGFCLQVAFPND